MYHYAQRALDYEPSAHWLLSVYNCPPSVQARHGMDLLRRINRYECGLFSGGYDLSIPAIAAMGQNEREVHLMLSELVEGCWIEVFCKSDPEIVGNWSGSGTGEVIQRGKEWPLQLPRHYWYTCGPELAKELPRLEAAIGWR